MLIMDQRIGKYHFDILSFDYYINANNNEFRFILCFSLQNVYDDSL